MKKLGLLLLAYFFCASLAQGQYYRRALGLRVGTSYSITYKQFLASWPFQQAIEGMAGFHLDERTLKQNAYVLEAYYVAHLDIGFDSRFAAFLGLGVFGGIYTEPGLKPYGGGGGTAMLGIEYNFRYIPLNISIDWNPILGYPRMSLTRGALTVRYLFPEGW